MSKSIITTEVDFNEVSKTYRGKVFYGDEPEPMITLFAPTVEDLRKIVRDTVDKCCGGIEKTFEGAEAAKLFADKQWIRDQIKKKDRIKKQVKKTKTVLKLRKGLKNLLKDIQKEK